MNYSHIQTPQQIYNIVNTQAHESNGLQGAFWIFLFIALFIFIYSIIKLYVDYRNMGKGYCNRWSFTGYIKSEFEFHKAKHHFISKITLTSVCLLCACFCLSMSMVASVHHGTGGNLTYSDPQSLDGLDINQSPVPYSNHLLIKHDIKYYYIYKPIKSKLVENSVSHYSYKSHIKHSKSNDVKLHYLNSHYYYPVHTFMNNHPIYNVFIGFVGAIAIGMLAFLFIAISAILIGCIFGITRFVIDNHHLTER